jgi:hypothetical protein
MLALVRFTNSSGTTRRPGSFSYEAALRSYDHPLSRSDDGNLRSSRETREQTRRCGRSWQKLSGVLSKPADLTRVCVPHLERRSISSTQPLMSSSLHLPSAICQHLITLKIPSIFSSLGASTPGRASRLFNFILQYQEGESFHFAAPAPTPAFSPSISPLTIFQAIPALRPRLSLDCSKLLPFSFSSRLILTTAAATPTETAKIGSRVLRWRRND